MQSRAIRTVGHISKNACWVVDIPVCHVHWNGKDGPRAYSFISRLNSEKASQHWEPITINGKLLTCPTEVATAFSPAPSPTEQGFLFLNKNFSYNELLLATNSKKKGKSVGPDGNSSLTFNSSLLTLVTRANTNKMEVSVEKTASQLFTLSTKQHSFHLEYKILPLKQMYLYKYLRINLGSHFGIPGNERADQKAKQGAESTEPEVPLTLRRAKSIISTHIAMTQKTTSFGKPWETLVSVVPIPRHLNGAESVARFRLTAGHDFFEVYLHWLGVAATTLRSCQNGWRQPDPIHWTL
ncbi:uncharacterized protein TNCV_4262781 [Trichonephila clavipes]|nr:uncharacterized protein TNCV_4262781 [Trichonephila clavipes]